MTKCTTLIFYVLLSMVGDISVVVLATFYAVGVATRPLTREV